jgi:hypothetical protein
MDLPLPSLDSIGLKFATDKSSQVHDYLSFYEPFLGALRQHPIRLLEIGVMFGSSLRMWQEYFPNALIVGADVHPGVKVHGDSRIMTEIVDQSNVEALVRLALRYGPFDVIVEDGSHRWEHQITSLKTLFPFVKNGGYYIAEDLHTSFGAMAQEFRGSASISTVEYLKGLAGRMVDGDGIDISSQPDAFARTYARRMHTLTFYKRACVLRKGAGSRSATRGIEPRP